IEDADQTGSFVSLLYRLLLLIVYINHDCQTLLFLVISWGLVQIMSAKLPYLLKIARYLYICLQIHTCCRNISHFYTVFGAKGVRFLYTFLFYLILPFIFLRLLWRSLRA